MLADADHGDPLDRLQRRGGLPSGRAGPLDLGRAQPVRLVRLDGAADRLGADRRLRVRVRHRGRRLRRRRAQGIYTTRIANNDNACGGSQHDASLVFLWVQAGAFYRIALDGWDGDDAGDYEIVADVVGDPGPPPANDDVAAAAGLHSSATDAAGTNVGATSGWNEWPADATQLVWWHWVSPVDGQVRVDTCGSDFDTVVGVMRRDDGEWAGGDIAHDGCGDRGMVELNAVQGRDYWIGVGGDTGASGAIELHIDATPDRTAPATTITSGPSSTWGRRVASIAWTVEDEAETTSECSLEAGPWFGCWGVEQLAGLAEGEHGFRVRSTDQYGNAEDPGAELRFTVVIPEAPNDDFAAAAALVPGVPASVNNGKATAEPGEPSHDSWYYAQGLGANRSVWFTFTPPADDVAELDWCASGFEVTVAVYTGTAVNALTRVGQRDEGCEDTLFVDGGVTYRVAIDGYARNLDYGTGPIAIELAYLGVDPDPDPSPSPSPEPSPSPSPIPAPTPIAEPRADPVITQDFGGSEPAAQAELRLDASRPARARVDRRGRFVVRGARVRCAGELVCAIPVEVLSRRRASKLGAATRLIARRRAAFVYRNP